jgi:DNA polymerase (family 10)
LHFTGSKEHNVKLRALAQSEGLSLSEHGLKTKAGIKLFESERAVYQALGLNYIEPELREDRGEIEASAKGYLPRLVQEKDIHGDIHVHSNWSDGTATINEMAAAAKAKGYNYIGFADHLERFNSAEKIEKRKSEIKKAAKKYGIHIFNACEVSIKKDGQIDYSDEILQRFDYVIASIHSNFDLSDSTSRLIAAIKNPYVKMIGHPSARMINRRPSINADWDKIFKACLQNDVILEINSSPYRLDLMDYLVFEGRKQKLRFAINTDAHSVSDFETLQYGLMVARRGWCEKSDIINASSLEEIKANLLK